MLRPAKKSSALRRREAFALSEVASTTLDDSRSKNKARQRWIIPALTLIFVFTISATIVALTGLLESSLADVHLQFSVTLKDWTAHLRPKTSMLSDGVDFIDPDSGPLMSPFLLQDEETSSVARPRGILRNETGDYGGLDIGSPPRQRQRFVWKNTQDDQLVEVERPDWSSGDQGKNACRPVSWYRDDYQICNVFHEMDVLTALAQRQCRMMK